MSLVECLSGATLARQDFEFAGDRSKGVATCSFVTGADACQHSMRRAYPIVVYA